MVSANHKIRVKFTKTGRLKFISHLDLSRTMKNALLRAKIPIWYSEGFNPRPKIVFAMPLSVGVESICEYMDIRLTEPTDIEFDFFTDEMKVVEIYKSDTNFNEIGYAEYKIEFDDEIDIRKLESPLIITKKSKNGEKEINIQPMVKCYKYSNRTLTALLSADNENYLNPEILAKALTKTGYDICRINVYLRDGETVFR